MPVSGTNLSNAFQGASTGATIGSVIPGIGTIAGAGIGGLISLIGGLFSASDTPQEQAMAQAMDILKDYMPELKKEAYSKDEIAKIVNELKMMYRSSADVAAGKIGSAIGESGAARGGGWADYYTQSLAPVIAQGEQGAASAEQFGVETYSNINNATKQRVLQGLQLMTQNAMGQPSMTSGQKGVAGFLQSLNLLSTAGGNIAGMYKNLKTQYPTIGQNGAITYGGGDNHG